MHGVILAAGEGSRMGPYTSEVPKAFMELAGRTLYDRQRDAIDPVVDGVTIVLGYAYENVLDRVGDANAVVFEEWAEYENGESLRRAVETVADDVLVLNGDVVVTESAVRHLVDRHAETERSVVACLPGQQNDSTAIRCDEEGTVTDYGLITGRQHAGLGVVDESHLDAAAAYLADHRHEWYPGVYTEIPTEAVTIPPDHHVEINYPRDKIDARNKLPFDAPDELDMQT